MTLFNGFKKPILFSFLFLIMGAVAIAPVSKMQAAAGVGHQHTPGGKICYANHGGGLGVDGDMGMGFGMGGYGMTQEFGKLKALEIAIGLRAKYANSEKHKQKQEAIQVLIKEKNQLQRAIHEKANNHDGHDHKEGEHCEHTDTEHSRIGEIDQEILAIRGESDLSPEENAMLADIAEREINAMSSKPEYWKSALNGFGIGIGGNLYKQSGSPKHDIAAVLVAKMTEPAGLVIAEHGKAFWTRVGIYLSKKWNRVSNIFFGTATFTTREVEAWKSEIKEVVKAFEDAYKRASGNASASHGLALRSGIFAEQAPGCTDEACGDVACGDNKKVVEEDPALKARKMYCSVQIKNLLQEVGYHKQKSKEDKPLCERALLVEIALHALADCIARQTSLNELNSAAIFDEISVWRDLAVSALNSIITATDPLVDVKLRTTSGYSGYGGYGSSGYGSNSF